MIEHDFKKYPELSNRQIEGLRYESPHQQITEDFQATVIKVHDGDTITLRTEFRDFDFPLRLLGIDAPELNEGGEEAGDWLRARILNKEIMVLITSQNRVDKYGRLLGRVFHSGLDVGEEEVNMGLATPFNNRKEGKLPSTGELFSIKQWL